MRKRPSPCRRPEGGTIRGLVRAYSLRCFALVCAAAQAGEPALDPDINAGKLPAFHGGVPLLWIPKCALPEKLSGDLSAPAWKQAAVLPFKDNLTKAAASFETQAFAFCTEQALYLGFRCREPKLKELKTSQGELWERDAVEIFLEPYKDTLKKPYHHAMLDAEGHADFRRYHVYQRFAGHPHYKESDWKPKLESATGRGEGFWTLEVALPYDQLVWSDLSRPRQTAWRMNLFRSRPAKGDASASLAWSPVGAARYHEAGKFGYVVLEVFAPPGLCEALAREATQAITAEKIIRGDPAELEQRYAQLSSASFDERQAAAERLKIIAWNDAALFELLEKKLKDLAAAKKSVESRAIAEDLLEELKVEKDRRTDDDPAPDEIK